MLNSVILVNNTHIYSLWSRQYFSGGVSPQPTSFAGGRSATIIALYLVSNCTQSWGLSSVILAKLLHLLVEVD